MNQNHGSLEIEVRPPQTKDFADSQTEAQANQHDGPKGLNQRVEYLPSILYWELLNVERNPMDLVEVKGISKRKKRPHVLQGENVLNSLSSGLVQGAEGAAFNAGVGHTLGVIAWAYGGEAPTWKDGAWFYESSPNTPGLLRQLLSGVTVGNVITGNGMEKHPGCYSDEECGGLEKPRTYDHELSHIPQSYALGFGYLPVNIVTMFIGASVELTPTDLKGAGHRNGLMERYWIHVTDYCKAGSPRCE